jgi:hypothetical protein
MNQLAARIGAIFYVIWGIVHINAAYGLLKLGQSLSAGMVQARIYQDAWNILFGALAVIVIAVTMNWRNSRTGFWTNLTLVSLLDIAFILFVIVPGYAPLWPGLEGPIAWVIAASCTAVGLAARTTPTTSAPGHRIQSGLSH